MTPGDEAGAAELGRRVADNLREHRRVSNLSLDELAKLSGVSRAALSQIETCKTNPSLSVLWKVAVGLEDPVRRADRREPRVGVAAAAERGRRC